MTVNGQRMSKSLGNRHRSDRGGGAVRRRSAAAVSGEGDCLRRRRRFLVGALRRALQRRSREQPRQPGQPRHGDGRSVSAGAAGADRRRLGSRWRASGEQAVARLPDGDGRARAARRRGGRVSTDRRAPTSTSPHRRRGRWRRIRRPPIGSTQVLFDAAEAIRLAAVLLTPDHAGVERGDPAPRRASSRRPELRSRRPLAHRRRASARSGRTTVAAQGAHDDD